MRVHSYQVRPSFLVAAPDAKARLVDRMITMKRLVATTLLATTLLPMTELPAVAAAAMPVAGAFNPLSIDRNKTRIFLPLKNIKILKRQSTVTSFQMELTSASSSMYTLERAVPQGVLHHLRIQTFEGKTYIRADWRHAAPVDVKVRSGGLDIFFYHKKAAPTFRTVASGVRYWEGQRWTGGGPMRVRALKLDPKKVSLEPAVATSGDQRMGLATVSHLAQRSGAIAAVNGGFFSPRTGEPQGTLVMHHNLVSRTMLDRPSIWLKANGQAYIKAAKPNASLKLGDGTSIYANAVNETAKRNVITLYTAHYGKTSRTYPDPSRWEYAVTHDGLVVAEGNGNLAIPPGGYVVSGQGKAYFDLRKWIGLGQELDVNFSIDPAVKHAMGGGPVLVDDGKVSVQTGGKRFQADILYGRAPRTAIGLLRDGSYMLVTVDGRHPGVSVGATLGEMAETMKELGVVEALNLDGGGSTTMWLRGQVVNRPSDGYERPVSNALLVMPRNQAVASALHGMLAANLAY